MIKRINNFISSLFFLVTVGLIGILPFRLMYAFSDFLALMLRKVFRYRYEVVIENLNKTDLQLSDNERKELIREIYRNLSDILLEGIKSFSMSRSCVIRRHKLLNPEILDPFFREGRSIILVTGHIGNWEWGSLSAGIQTPYRIVGFYKPLKNKFINKVTGRSRSKFGTILAPIRQTSLSFDKYREVPTMFLMAADQNPVKVELSHWIPFLGRPTAFLHGPEKHARSNNYPVIFTTIDRVKRGYYELRLSLLSENPAEQDPGVLTKVYVEKLESVLRQTPHSWLWTHRRWKHKPPTGPN
jgi:Kdo2-lipid IVA lauroyltransferase/acyltransferase